MEEVERILAVALSSARPTLSAAIQSCRQIKQDFSQAVYKQISSENMRRITTIVGGPENGQQARMAQCNGERANRPYAAVGSSCILAWMPLPFCKRRGGG